MKKVEIEDLAWNLISELPTCSQGHIISHADAVNCMLKFLKKVKSKEILCSEEVINDILLEFESRGSKPSDSFKRFFNKNIHNFSKETVDLFISLND